MQRRDGSLGGWTHKNREQEVWSELKLYKRHLSDQTIKSQAHLGFSFFLNTTTAKSQDSHRPCTFFYLISTCFLGRTMDEPTLPPSGYSYKLNYHIKILTPRWVNSLDMSIYKP